MPAPEVAPSEQSEGRSARVGTAPSKVSDRDSLIRLWRRVLSRPIQPGSTWQGRAPTVLCVTAAASTLTESQELLRDCERLMRRLLRTSWARLPRTQRGAIKRKIRAFDLDRTTITVASGQADAAAWLVAAMHWCGCRHPAALFAKPLHPATGIVRWLTAFEISRQVERPRDIIALLPKKMAIIDQRSRVLVATMIARRRVVALLPELLR
ncbi:hypothetical protein [Variovorax ginsengisoli]|uniref:Uncharacterized protein n=1 Tax=Variovorax ginsengisoli TaxID=363844 RepID=A0ABT8SEN1_9BURK|nr:hypothetical protein [Variovorax ginsengisoli]MDN8618215.1 hypothetical protein [Variovorax ginsengisoli]MDO1537385.1 hypothetical protein [Variovorax ginsengisoli]